MVITEQELRDLVSKILDRCIEYIPSHSIEESQDPNMIIMTTFENNLLLNFNRAFRGHKFVFDLTLSEYYLPKIT